MANSWRVSCDVLETTPLSFFVASTMDLLIYDYIFKGQDILFCILRPYQIAELDYQIS